MPVLQDTVLQDTNSLSFEALSLHPKLLEAIAEMDYKEPTSIQAQVIPQILLGKDVIAKAQTGSGKTAAFGLPAMHLISESPDKMVLVLTPTRELSLQVCRELEKFGKHLSIKPAAIYGGEPLSRQLNRLSRDRRFIVATPGRLLDLFRSGHLDDFAPNLVVLDESDEMLNMGFLEDIQTIFSFLPKERQTLLFSATMPAQIKKISKQFLKDPVLCDTLTTEEPHEDIHQIYHLVPEGRRTAALLQLFAFYAPMKSIIFCNTKKQVDELCSELSLSGFFPLALHGDMSQKDRELSIQNFRNSPSKILIATDVAGRGINVTDVSHVFNYELPYSPDCYTHRIGRTGRMGNKGTAITLLSPKQAHLIKKFSPQKGAVGKPSDIALTPLPSPQELKARQHSSFIEKIKAEALHPDATAFYTELKKTFTEEEIALRLLSMKCRQEKRIINEEHLVVSPSLTHEKRERSSRERGDRPFGKFARGGAGGGKRPFGNSSSFKGKPKTQSGSYGSPYHKPSSERRDSPYSSPRKETGSYERKDSPYSSPRKEGSSYERKDSSYGPRKFTPQRKPKGGPRREDF